MTSSTSVDGITTLSFATSSVSNSGLYKVDATYSLERYPTILKVLSFDLTMFVLNSPPALSQQSYMVGETVKTISYGLFSITPTSSSLVFTYSSTLDDGSPLPSFISGVLTLSDYEFTIYSSVAADAGTYILKVTALVSGTGQSTSLSTSFTLVVTAPAPLAIINQPPYFVSDLTLDFSIFAGEEWEYQLPDSVDPQ